MFNKLPIFALFALLACSSAQGTITMIEELYNPELNQTVIIGGDHHFTTPAVDNAQCKALIDTAQQHNALTIVEGENSEKEPSILLNKLACAAQHYKIPYIDAEFRLAFAQVHSYMLQATHEHPDSYNAMQKLFDTTDIEYLIAQNLDASHDQGTVVAKILWNCRNLLGKSSLASELYLHDLITTTIEQFDKLYAEIHEFLHEGEEKRIFNNFFAPAENDGWNINTGSIVHLAEQANYPLFDLHLLYLIHTHPQQRTIFVMTGTLHAQPIINHLKNMGYISKQSIANALKPGVTIDMRKENAQEIIDSAVDCQKFLSQCSTLAPLPAKTEDNVGPIRKIARKVLSMMFKQLA